MKKIGITIILGIIIGTGIGFAGVTALGSSNHTTSKNTIIATKTSNIIAPIAAKSIILNKIPGSTITSFNFENSKDGTYMATAVNGTTEYTISVNATTGAIINLSNKTVANITANMETPSGFISEKKAIDIATTKVPNSKLTGLSLNYKNIAPEYDLIMQTTKTKNYICINAKTGDIISSNSINL